MISIVSLFVAAALVSQYSGFEANAQIENSGQMLDDKLMGLIKKTPRRKNYAIGRHIKFSEMPEPMVKRYPGEKTVLTCTVRVNPPASIQWLRNGIVVQAFDDVKEILPLIKPGVFVVTSKLVITSRTPGEDKYSCMVVPGDPSLQKKVVNSIVYTVEPNDDQPEVFSPASSPPTISFYYSTVFQTEGDLVFLPCRVTTVGDTELYWKDNENMIIFDNPRMKVLSSGDLVINNLMFEDKGNFTCIAKNKYGQDSTTTYIYAFKPN